MATRRKGVRAGEKQLGSHVAETTILGMCAKGKGRSESIIVAEAISRQVKPNGTQGLCEGLG